MTHFALAIFLTALPMKTGQKTRFSGTIWRNCYLNEGDNSYQHINNINIPLLTETNS